MKVRKGVMARRLRVLAHPITIFLCGFRSRISLKFPFRLTSCVFTGATSPEVLRWLWLGTSENRVSSREPLRISRSIQGLSEWRSLFLPYGKSYACITCNAGVRVSNFSKTTPAGSTLVNGTDRQRRRLIGRVLRTHRGVGRRQQRKYHRRRA